MCNTNSTRNLTIGFLAGSAIGLALGVLYAPRPGRETRHKVSERGHEAKEAAEKIIHESQEKAENIIGQARSKAETLMHHKRKEVTGTENPDQEAG